MQENVGSVNESTFVKLIKNRKFPILQLVQSFIFTYSFV